MKGLLLAATLMLAANGLMAQSYTETALMFSRTRPTGSARILGMGGAQISLGGDFSSSYSNPAGLGMFNRSEFTITPGYLNINTNGTYTAGNAILSDNNKDNRTALGIPGFGLVFSRPQNSSGFIHGSFGITMTRVNDFNTNIRYEGNNSSSSLIDYFIDQANGDTPDQFADGGSLYNSVTGLAYDNYLIGEAEILDPSFPRDEYFTDFDPGVNPNVFQDESIQTKGAQNQWNFSYGANFDDKFFLGAGLGIVSLNYQSHKTFRESFTDQPIIGYRLVEDLQIRGTGINLTVGAIGRPIDGVQLGASIATPTRYNLTDTYSATLSSNWDAWDYYGDGSVILGQEGAETGIVTSGYNLNTPWKFSAGASYIFGKAGLLSLDIEHLNYGGAKYNSQTNGVSYSSDNNEIKSLYTSVTNYRLGGEVRVKSLRFRAGGSYMPDPFKEEQNDTNNSRVSISGGVGYRASKFYIDLAYINTFGNSTYRPYTVGFTQSPLLKYQHNISNVVATLGFSF